MYKNVEKLVSFNRFFGYVGFLVALGMCTCGIAVMMGAYALKWVLLSGSGIILILILFFVSWIFSWIAQWMLNKGINSNSVTMSTGLYFVSTFCTGFTLAPVGLIGLLSGFGEIMMAFGISVVFFLCLSGYAALSKSDFRPLRGILVVGMFIMIFMALGGFIISWMWPQMFNIFDIIRCSLGLLFSMGLVLYETSELKNLYDKQHSSKTIMNLGIIGASRLFQTFVMMFMYIFSLLRHSRNNKRGD